MITYPTKAVELKAVSKRYPFIKTAVNDIYANFEDFWPLKDISLEVYRRQVLGIIGRNGAGKTTLLNIIAGTLSPTQGERIVNGRALGLFNLGIGFQDELTGRENIYLNGAIIGAAKKELDDKLNSIIEFSELGNFINAPLGIYSQGMRLRLGFSIIANLDFDTLVIDEVLAVGDTLFQNKCFERLMDSKRSGKTLIITTQSMDLIERLCDKVALLDHGHLLFYGDTLKGINKYRALLSTEKFFVGPAQKNINLVENTKKWAEDPSNWGKRLGTKEVVIESAELINRFGHRCEAVRSGDPLKIKVNFIARNDIKEPHFGVAIFRNDGVYCYGPNTTFDGHSISEFRKGRGRFILYYHRLLLAPGEYRLSVAIWDKNETLAFDYHNGCYRLTVNGRHNGDSALLNMPFMFNPGNIMHKFIPFQKRTKPRPNLKLLNDKWGRRFESDVARIKSVKLLNSLGEQKDVFVTDEPMKILINFDSHKAPDKNSYLWIGVYRDDGIYCQGITMPFGKRKDFHIFFPYLLLLPGGYKLSVGVWDAIERKFLMHHHGIYPFRMVFNRQDHGTIYLPHKWVLQ